MRTESRSGTSRQLVALWVTVVVESIMIVASYAYNIYEVRRNSELVQSKVNGLAEYSSRQGEKIDRMTTALELYVGEKLKLPEDDPADGDPRIEKAKAFLDKLRHTGEAGEVKASSPVSDGS